MAFEWMSSELQPKYGEVEWVGPRVVEVDNGNGFYAGDMIRFMRTGDNAYLASDPRREGDRWLMDLDSRYVTHVTRRIAGYEDDWPIYEPHPLPHYQVNNLGPREQTVILGKAYAEDGKL